MGEDRHRLAVLDHERQALGRVARIQGQVGAARLDDRQQAQHQLAAPRQADGHAVVGPDAQLDEPVGQLIGARIQLAVSEAFVALNDRRRVGRAGSSFLDEAMDRAMARIVHAGGVPILQQLLALLVPQHGQATQHPAFVGDHGRQQAPPVVEEAGHRFPVEHGRGVFDLSGEGLAHVRERQGKIEFGGGAFDCEDRRGGQPGQLMILLGAMLPGKHHLEQGTVGQGAGRIDDLDDLLEGNVLIALCGQGPLLDPFQELGHGRFAGGIDAHGQGVDEEADQALHLGLAPVGTGRADDDIVLAGEPGEDGAPTAQQRHVGRGADAAAQGLDGVGHFLVQ